MAIFNNSIAKEDLSNKVVLKYLEGAEVQRLEEGFLMGKLKNGKKIHLEYVPGGTISDVKLTIGNKGKFQPIEGGYRSTVYVDGGQKKVWLGELILQMERLADDLPLMVGEYNHCLPRYYCKNYNLAERFGQDGPVGGEVISHEDNQIHWNLCEKIRKQTGFLVSFMMSDDNTAPIKIVREFNRNMIMGLHEAGILRIIEDLGDPSED